MVTTLPFLLTERGKSTLPDRSRNAVMLTWLPRRVGTCSNRSNSCLHEVRLGELPHSGKTARESVHLAL